MNNLTRYTAADLPALIDLDYIETVLEWTNTSIVCLIFTKLQGTIHLITWFK